MHGRGVLALSCSVSLPGLCACCPPLPAAARCCLPFPGPRREMGDGRKMQRRQRLDLHPKQCPPPLPHWPLERKASWRLSLPGTCRWVPLVPGTGHPAGVAPAAGWDSETPADPHPVTRERARHEGGQEHQWQEERDVRGSSMGWGTPG